MSGSPEDKAAKVDKEVNDFRAGPHAYRRAEEKFGLVLSRHDMDDIVRRIEDGYATPMGKADREGKRCYLVEVRGKRLFAVFVPGRRFVVTFLTEAEWREARGRHHHNAALVDKEKAWRDRCRNGKRPAVFEPEAWRRLRKPGSAQ
jgi:hypothetical protein